MSIIRELGQRLQTVLGPSLDPIGRRTGVIRRRRKFTAMTLLQTLVLTLLKSPLAKPDRYAMTAAKLGVIVTPEAIQKRFTDRLVAFLRAALERALTRVIAHGPVDLELLRRFTAVRVGDSTSISLPREYAAEFPGCGGAAGSGKAALKIQVLWDLLTGGLLTLELEPGSAADARSVLVEGPVPAGSLTILDLGYFGVDRFAEVGRAGAYWISRWQINTAAFDPEGRPLDPLDRARGHRASGPVDRPILLGAGRRLPCRLIILRAPQEVAARRRQRASEKAKKHGRSAGAEQLAWCDYTAFVTNAPAALLTWKEVVVLYRARWQVELLFKLWKSHGQLDKAAAGRPAEWVMAELLAKLIGVIIQHWVLLALTWADPRRSLRKAARSFREWVDLLTDSLADLDRLTTVLERLGASIGGSARVKSRNKRPSSFQLLGNPELLDYTS